ncbi:MAG: hypothetical protein ACXW4B_09535 [Micavibrio sp.]
MTNHEFITGSVNEYYQDNASLPRLTDEVYARRNPDRQSWTVYRLRTRPIPPEAFTEAAITPLFSPISGIAPTLFELPEVVASHVDLKAAFDLVRKHEITPPKNPEGGTLRQVCRAEDVPTHWAQLPIQM